MTLNIISLGGKYFLPIRRLYIPFSFVQRRTFCNYYAKKSVPYISSFRNGLYSCSSSPTILSKDDAQEITLCNNIATSSSSASPPPPHPSAGKKSSKSDSAHVYASEDVDMVEEQLSKYEEGDMESLLEFLKSAVHRNEFNNHALSATIKLLLNRLNHTESFSEQQTILHCVETLYNPILAYLDTMMDLNTLIRLLEVFVILQAPRDHTILTSIVKLLSKKYRGELSLHQIVYLETVLQKMVEKSKSPLSTSLSSSLPLHFERRLNLPLDPKDVDTLEANKDMTWTPLSSVGPNIIQLLIGDILDKILIINHTQACNLLLFLTDCNIKRDVPEVNKLLPILFKILTDKIQCLDSDHLAILVTKCADKFECGYEEFYNAEFMNALHANDIRHINAASLMGHVDERYLYSVSLLADLPGRLMHPDLLLAFVHLFSTAGCPPDNFQQFIDHKILDHAAQTMHSPELNVSLTLDLLAMGCKPLVDYVEKIFKPSQEVPGPSIPLEESGLGKRVCYGPIPLLLITSAIRILYPDPSFEGHLPDGQPLEQLQGAAKAQTKMWKYPIQSALENGFGGPDFVMTDLWHHGVHIDHCIIVNKRDGSPVRVNKDFVLHGFHKEDNRLPILIKVHPKQHYVAHTQRLRGVYELESKVLRTLGFPLINVNLEEWDGLKDREKNCWLIGIVKNCWKKTLEAG